MSSAPSAAAGASSAPAGPPAKVEPRSFLYGVTLGEGAYARVLHCRLRAPAAAAASAPAAAPPAAPGAASQPRAPRAPPDFAVKVMEKHLIKRENKAGLVMLERQVLSRAQHPNIVRLAYSFQDTKYLYFVMELCRGRELFKAIRGFAAAARKAGRADEGAPLPVTRFVVAQLVSTLAYLHGSLCTVHRDLKPDNVMLSEKGHIKLIDFGSVKDESKATPGGAPPARPQGGDGEAIAHWVASLHAGWDPAAFPRASGSSGGRGSVEGGAAAAAAAAVSATAAAAAEPDAFVGTAEYVSPEVLSDEPAHAPADLWALGAVLYQCITGRPPCRGASEYLTFQQILGLDAEASAAWLGMDLSAPVALASPEETVGERLAALRAASTDDAAAADSVHARAAAVRSRLAPQLASSFDVLAGAGVHTLASPGDSPWATDAAGDAAAARSRRTASVALPGGLLGLTGDGAASDRRSVRAGSVCAALASAPPASLLLFPPHAPLVAVDLVCRLMRSRPSQRLGVLGMTAVAPSEEGSSAASAVDEAAAGSAPRPAPAWAQSRPPPFYCGPVALDYGSLKAHPLFSGIEWETLCDPKASKAPWVPAVDPLPEPTESSPDGFASLSLLGEDGEAAATPQAQPAPIAAAAPQPGALVPLPLSLAGMVPLASPARGAAPGGQQQPSPSPASSSGSARSDAKAGEVAAPQQQATASTAPPASASSSVAQFFETLLSGGSRSFSSSTGSSSASSAAAAPQPPPSPTRSLTPSRGGGGGGGRDSARGAANSWLDASPGGGGGGSSSRPGPVTMTRDPTPVVPQPDEEQLPTARLCLTGLGLPEDDEVVAPVAAEGGSSTPRGPGTSGAGEPLRRSSSARGSRAATLSFPRRPSAASLPRGPATDVGGLVILDYFPPPPPSSSQGGGGLASALGGSCGEGGGGSYASFQPLVSEGSSGSLVRTTSPAASRRGSHALASGGDAFSPGPRCPSPAGGGGGANSFYAASPGGLPRSPSPAPPSSKPSNVGLPVPAAARPASSGAATASPQRPSSSSSASATPTTPSSSSSSPSSPSPPWGDAYWAAFLDRAAGEEPLAWARMQKRNPPVLFPLWHALPLLHPAAGSVDRDVILTHFPGASAASGGGFGARVPRLLYCHPQGKSLRLAIDLRPEPEARRGSTVPALDADAGRGAAGGEGGEPAAQAQSQPSVSRVSATADGTSLDISVQAPRGKTLALTVVGGGWGGIDAASSETGAGHASASSSGSGSSLGHALGGMFSPPSFLRSAKKKAAAAAGGGGERPPLAPPQTPTAGASSSSSHAAAEPPSHSAPGRPPPGLPAAADEPALASAWARAISALAAGLPAASAP